MGDYLDDFKHILKTNGYEPKGTIDPDELPDGDVTVPLSTIAIAVWQWEQDRRRILRALP